MKNSRKTLSRHTTLVFLYLHLLNKLSKNVPVDHDQVLRQMCRASKTDQPGISSSIFSEVTYARTQDGTKKIAQRIWRVITLEYFRNLYKTVLRRIAVVKGIHHEKY